MGRKKGSKNEVKKKIEEKEINLPQKDLFRPDEVADYLRVSRSTIYLWIDNNILDAEKIGGVVRVPRASIVKCRMLSE